MTLTLNWVLAEGIAAEGEANIRDGSRSTIMKLDNKFLAIIIFTLCSCSSVSQNMSPEQLEVWRLEEQRMKYVSARDIESFRGMYHKDFIGWPNRVTSPIGQTDLGGGILDAIAKGLKPSKVELRREAVRIFGDVAMVHLAMKRNLVSTSDETHREGDWIKITHTWKREGNTWKIIGGMSAPLDIRSH